MNGYTIPKAYSTFPADDGGVMVVDDRQIPGRLTKRDAALILAASYGYEADEIGRAARKVEHLACPLVLHRCLASDEIGEEPGWWDTRGSGMGLPCVYFPPDAVRELA